MRLAISVVLVLAILTAGCTRDENDPRFVVEKNQIELRGEQVLLSADQMRCGDRKGLWKIELMDGARSVGRLTSLGRQLGFDDDVFVGSKKISGPYAQVRGPFTLKAGRVESISEENTDVKVIQAKVGVVIEHECFTEPLTLAGVDQGEFSEVAAARIRLRQHNGWTVDGFVH